METKPISGGINDSTVEIIAEIAITKTLLDRIDVLIEKMKLELEN